VKLHRTPSTEDEAALAPPDESRYREIGRVQAALLRVWGPADSWDSPLVGTRYDPNRRAERQHDSLEFRRQRWEDRKRHWDERRHPQHPDSTASGVSSPDE
jgi:hypothetical protein